MTGLPEDVVQLVRVAGVVNQRAVGPDEVRVIILDLDVVDGDRLFLRPLTPDYGCAPVEKANRVIRVQSLYRRPTPPLDSEPMRGGRPDYFDRAVVMNQLYIREAFIGRDEAAHRLVEAPHPGNRVFRPHEIPT